MLREPGQRVIVSVEQVLSGRIALMYVHASPKTPHARNNDFFLNTIHGVFCPRDNRVEIQPLL